MKYLNEFHKKSAERKMQEMQEWRKSPMKSHEAVAYMKKNMEEAEQYYRDYLHNKEQQNR